MAERAGSSRVIADDGPPHGMAGGGAPRIMASGCLPSVKVDTGPPSLTFIHTIGEMPSEIQ